MAKVEVCDVCGTRIKSEDTDTFDFRKVRLCSPFGEDMIQFEVDTMRQIAKEIREGLL